MLLYAHLACRAPEAGSTFGVAGALAVLLIRPWRRPAWRDKLTAFAIPLVLATVVTAGACSTKSTSTARPVTPAKIFIESPTANEVTPATVTVKVRLVNGVVVPQTTGKLTATDGHIHLAVDGKVVSMAYGTTQDIGGLTPGNHTLQAEFVAKDHKPFKNRPTAVVLFSVKAP
jgi:hypothetical protein